MNFNDPPAWGQTFDAAVIEAGLRRLQPDMHFDMGPKLGMYHPWQTVRQGVYYLGRHICSMDRGRVPEYKVWSVAEHEVPVSIHEADDEDCRLRYELLPHNTLGYLDIKNEALKGRVVDAVVRDDGEVMRLRAYKIRKERDRIVLVGWRHTFETILLHQVPLITRQNLGETFGVDMYKYPVGAPQEVFAQLHAEV